MADMPLGEQPQPKRLRINEQSSKVEFTLDGGVTWTPSGSGIVSGYDQTITIDGVVNPVTNSITFTGLNGDTDGIYSYDGYIVHGGNANVNILLNPNGLTANKFMRGVLYSPTSILQFGFADWISAENATNGQTNGGYSLLEGTLYAKSGKVRLLRFSSSNFTNSTSTELDSYFHSGWWKDTATNLTSLQFSHATANGFGVGTTIRVRRVSGSF